MVLFRHAEKASRGLALNPPLSDRGLRQAQNLVDLVAQNILPTPTKIYVSPLVRTQQTASFCAEHLKLKLEISEELHERQEGERQDSFNQRVGKFLKWIEYQPGTNYLFTHFDWIESAMLLLHSDTDLSQEKYYSWSSGQYMHFELQDDLWNLQNYGKLKGD